jgi:hypothetical protein
MSCTLPSFDLARIVWRAPGAGVAGVVTAGVVTAGVVTAGVVTAGPAATAGAGVARETGTVYDTSFEGRLSPAVLNAVTAKKYVRPSFKFETNVAVMFPTSISCV